jgi:hypothetical protein
MSPFAPFIPFSQSYVGYDANGNYANDTTGPNNQLLIDSTNTYSYSYDNEGNRARRIEIATTDVTDYEYDHSNRLIGVAEATANLTTLRWVGSAAGSLRWLPRRLVAALF